MVQAVPAPPTPDASSAAAAAPPAAARALRRQLLVYTPDGPVGGTFTCTQCQAQGWQPDLLDHAALCPYRAPMTDG